MYFYINLSIILFACVSLCLFKQPFIYVIFLGLPPGLVSSQAAAAGLLAGLPPVSSAAAFAAQMARLPTPLLNHMEASRKEEEAKSLSSTPLGPASTPLGPHSEERHVRLFKGALCDLDYFK